MKRILFALLALALTSQLVMADDNVWTEKAQNPSWWPYRHYDPKRPSVREDMIEWYADLEPPCPTNRTIIALSSGAWRKAQVVTNEMQLVATDDPFKEVPGYWPTFYGAAAYLDGKYMIAAGQMCNWALSQNAGNKFYFPGMSNFCNFLRNGTKSGDLIDYAYFWPSNSYAYASEQFSYNRSVQFHIYDVASDTWDSSKYDGSGPPTYVNMESGKCPARWIDDNEDSWQVQEAVMRDGVRCGSNQAFLYDFDESGTPSFFLHGGYPSWEGTFSIYNPNRKPKQDPESPYGAWSGSNGAITDGAFGGSYHCHYGGGAVCIDGVAYVLGGGYWGQDAGLCMQTYNTKTDQWRAYENLYPNNLSDFGIATWGSKIYLLGDSSISSKIRVMDTDTNVYKFVDSELELQIPVRAPAVVGYNGVIYAIGGQGRVQVIEDGQTNTVSVTGVSIPRA